MVMKMKKRRGELNKPSPELPATVGTPTLRGSVSGGIPASSL